MSFSKYKHGVRLCGCGDSLVNNSAQRFKVLLAFSVESYGAAGVHARERHFPGIFTVKRHQGKVLLCYIHCGLTVVRVQVQQMVILEANEEQRVLWFAPNDANAAL